MGLANQVLADDDDRHTGGADVLLHATVDEAVLLHVDGLGEVVEDVRHERTSPTSGTSLNSTPPMVSLEQMWTNLASGVSFQSFTSGMVLKLESLDVAARFTVMYFSASAWAFLPHAPVTMNGNAALGGEVHGDSGELRGGTALEEKHLWGSERAGRVVRGAVVRGFASRASGGEIERTRRRSGLR